MILIKVKLNKKFKVLHKKFQYLKRTTHTKEKMFFSPKFCENVVYNLSSETFNTEELNMLNYGLNFTLVPKQMSYEELIVDLESGLRWLPGNKPKIARSELYGI